jgi:hypothetical protein
MLRAAWNHWLQLLETEISGSHAEPYSGSCAATRSKRNPKLQQVRKGLSLADTQTGFAQDDPQVRRCRGCCLLLPLTGCKLCFRVLAQPSSGRQRECVRLNPRAVLSRACPRCRHYSSHIDGKVSPVHSVPQWALPCIQRIVLGQNCLVLDGVCWT